MIMKRMAAFYLIGVLPASGHVAFAVMASTRQLRRTRVRTRHFSPGAWCRNWLKRRKKRCANP
jgi:hypothetical protein